MVVKRPNLGETGLGPPEKGGRSRNWGAWSGGVPCESAKRVSGFGDDDGGKCRRARFYNRPQGVPLRRRVEGSQRAAGAQSSIKKGNRVSLSKKWRREPKIGDSKQGNNRETLARGGKIAKQGCIKWLDAQRQCGEWAVVGTQRGCKILLGHCKRGHRCAKRSVPSLGGQRKGKGQRFVPQLLVAKPQIIVPLSVLEGRGLLGYGVPSAALHIAQVWLRHFGLHKKQPEVFLEEMPGKKKSTERVGTSHLEGCKLRAGVVEPP